MQIFHRLVSSSDTEGSILAIYSELPMHSNELKLIKYIKHRNIL